jgi:hypothetical protein
MSKRLTKRQFRHFKENLHELWVALKSHTRPEFHADLRKAFKRIIREDEREFNEFVELMETKKEKTAVEAFEAGGRAVAALRAEMANEKPQEAAYDMADERQLIEEGSLTHQCHYCGDMYPVSDLSGAAEGLICYKCRHEMENRD